MPHAEQPGGQRDHRAEGGHEAEDEHHDLPIFAEDMVERLDILPLQRRPAAIAVDERLQPAEAQYIDRAHTSELQSLMRISYAVFCLTQKTNHQHYKLHID